MPEYNIKIATKAWETKASEYKELCILAKENNAEIINLPDNNYDFGAYYEVAKNLKSEYIFCLVSSSIILDDNWLMKFKNAFGQNKELGLLGACGSWECTPDPWYFIQKELRSEYKQKSWKYKIIKAYKRYKYRILRKLFFKQNLISPNYHIRTNAFMLKRSLYLDFISHYGLPNTKPDAYLLESSYKSLSKFVLSKGLKIGVLGKDETVYPPENWKESKTYISSDLSNVIIKDKYYDAYKQKEYLDKKIYELSVWGDFVTNQKEFENQDIKFSVLLPTKNRLGLLKYAVKSVLQQNYDNWEIIISDNCSQEDVQGYVKDLNDCRIKYLRTDKPLTVTENWNNANDAATGDYIIMLGDDDALLPDFFTKCREILQEARRPEILTFGAYLYLQPDVSPVSPKGNVAKLVFPFVKPEGVDKEYYYVAKNDRRNLVQDSLNFRYNFGFNMQYFLYSRDFIARAKFFGELYQPPYPDYYTANIMLLLAKTFVVLPEPMVIIGITPKSYGYYYLNNIEKKGMVFHNDAEYRLQAPKRLKKRLCNIDEIHTAALVTFARVCKVDKNLKLNITAYYKKIIARIFENYNIQDAGKVFFKEVLPKTGWRYSLPAIYYWFKNLKKEKKYGQKQQPLPEISYENISLLLEDIRKGKLNV